MLKSTSLHSDCTLVVVAAIALLNAGTPLAPLLPVPRSRCQPFTAACGSNPWPQESRSVRPSPLKSPVFRCNTPLLASCMPQTRCSAPLTSEYTWNSAMQAEPEPFTEGRV